VLGVLKLRKVFQFNNVLVLHCFISRSGVVLGLWKLIYGNCSFEVCWPYCDGTYWSLVVDIYVSLRNREELRKDVAYALM
jgi:hypothetical protein